MWQENFYEALMDSVVDCLKMLPILFLAYLLVSYLSHDHNHKFSGFLSKKKKTSVLYASFLGCVPQCGFSTVIADLYSKQKVTLGTLVAVFIATSDEAIPIMISSPDTILDMLLLIGIKIVLALVWGYGIDFVVGATCISVGRTGGLRKVRGFVGHGIRFFRFVALLLGRGFVGRGFVGDGDARSYRAF